VLGTERTFLPPSFSGGMVLGKNGTGNYGTLKMEKLLYINDLFTLHKKAVEEGKILILKINHVDNEGKIHDYITHSDIITQWTQKGVRQDALRVCQLAGDLSDWEKGRLLLTIGSGSTCIGEWKTTQAGKRDLLSFLDNVTEPDLITQILNGALKVLEPEI
jgi:hypothetical protein